MIPGHNESRRHYCAIQRKFVNSFDSWGDGKEKKNETFFSLRPSPTNGNLISMTNQIRVNFTHFSEAPKTKTIFYAIQSIFRRLEMHSKRRYKICVCSVILGELDQVFSKLQ